jgi:hypothetical protein
MERLPSDTQATLWMEFQMEKLNLLKWAFEVEPETAANQGVFYLDSDICFLAPLPVPPEDPSIEVGLSPHYIRKHDEERFGRYNAGYVWMRSVDAVEAWRAACADSTFFEQAALEVFDTDTRWASKRYIFPIQHNYGWWRMWQSERSPTDCLKEWGIFRTQSSSGIVVQGKPLASVHTHWVTNDSATAQFNKIVYEFLKRLASAHPPAAHLLKSLPSPHQKLKG